CDAGGLWIVAACFERSRRFGTINALASARSSRLASDYAAAKGPPASRPIIPHYRTLRCDSDDLTDRRIGSAQAIEQACGEETCRRAGRENRRLLALRER